MLYFLNRICIFVLFFFGFVLISHLMGNGSVIPDAITTQFQKNIPDVLGSIVTKTFPTTGAAVSASVATGSDSVSTKILTPMEKLAYNQYATVTAAYIPDIGAYVETSQTGLPVITQIVKNSPATQVGLKVSDVVTAVNGKDINNLSASDIEKVIDGEEGSPVMLTVLHKDNTTPVTIPIVRKTIEEPTVVDVLKNTAQENISEAATKLGIDEIVEKTQDIRSGVATFVYYAKKVIGVFFSIINALSRFVSYIL